MTAGIKQPGGNRPSKYQQFKKPACCSCLLDYGVGEDYKEGKPKDL